MLFETAVYSSLFLCVYSPQQLLPCGEGISPVHISEKEELERLAGLELRDSLVRGLGVGEHLHVSLDQKTTPSTTRPPSSSTCPRTCDDNEERLTTGQQQAPTFFTHVVIQDRINSDMAASQSASSLPNENTVITSVTNSTESTPLHSLPGAEQGVGHERSPAPERNWIQSHSFSTLHSSRRSHSYGLESGSYAHAVNNLSTAYHRPTCASGSKKM